MHYRARSYDPRTGRFIQKDPVLSVRVSEHYVYAQNTPLTRVDPTGQQSREQIEAIAKQLGVADVEPFKNEQTKLIKEVQTRLGIVSDGLWGNNTYDTYLKWARDNALPPVILASSVTINAVTNSFKTYIQKYGVPGSTPSLGIMVAIAYYESRDSRGRGGLGVPAEFNAAASPFARMNSRPTAVGIMQVNEATLRDLIKYKKRDMMELLELTDDTNLEAEAMKARYDADKSVGMAMILIKWDISDAGKTLEKALGRWEAYTKRPSEIEALGKALEKAGLGQPGANAPLLEILRKGAP